MRMDLRLLAFWEKVAVGASREQMKNMMYAVRVGFNADKSAFERVIHDLTHDVPKETQVADTWELLEQVGGG